MSAVELILNNPLIVATMALAALIMFIAFAMVAVVLIRKMIADRKRRMLFKPAPPFIDIDEDDALEDTSPAPPVKWASNRATTEATTVTNAVETNHTTPPFVQTPQSTTDQPTPEEEEQVTEAMQDILSSVFADESEDQRFTVLLQDKAPVSAEELAILAQTVLAQMTQPQRYARKGRLS